MNKKSVIIIASISLNLVLLAALAYFSEINSHFTTAPAPFFQRQHMADSSYLPSDHQEMALASNVK